MRKMFESEDEEKRYRFKDTNDVDYNDDEC